jgi:hypothetical protein
MDMSDDARANVKKAAAALASQLLAALAGWLQVDAATAADPLALTVFTANLAASRLRGVPPPAKLAQWMLFALCSSLFVLSSCSSTSQDALQKRLESALTTIGKEASASALQSTLAFLRVELDTLLKKPVDDDPMQQLVDQNRISALKAAIKLGEERLAKLRGDKAVIDVQPLTVSPSHRLRVSESPHLKVSTSPRPQLPRLAPQIVAHLSASH